MVIQTNENNCSDWRQKFRWKLANAYDFFHSMAIAAITGKKQANKAYGWEQWCIKKNIRTVSHLCKCQCHVALLSLALFFFFSRWSCIIQVIPGFVSTFAPNLLEILFFQCDQHRRCSKGRSSGGFWGMIMIRSVYFVNWGMIIIRFVYFVNWGATDS